MSSELEFRRRIERLARMENIKDAKKDTTKEKEEKVKDEEKKMIRPSIDGVRKSIENFENKKHIEDEER